MTVRLNKLLASRGIGSRRRCDDLVFSGVVRVNGRTVTEPGTQVDPQRDVVEVEGRALPGRQKPAYYLLHKPVGVISTLSDPEGRRTIAELVPRGTRVFPVGRLDADTSGLMILTNDGDLAHHLMHPRYGVAKCYRAHIRRAPSPAMLERLKHGIEFEPGVVSAPARVRVLGSGPDETVLEIELHEGRYRQVRRMCEAAGLEVLRLHRWAYGPLKLGTLPRGACRPLTTGEVDGLRGASSRPTRRPAVVRARPRGPRGERSAAALRGRERAPREYRGVVIPGLVTPAARGGRRPAPARRPPPGPRTARGERPGAPERSGRGRPGPPRRGPGRGRFDSARPGQDRERFGAPPARPRRAGDRPRRPGENAERLGPSRAGERRGRPDFPRPRPERARGGPARGRQERELRLGFGPARPERGRRPSGPSRPREGRAGGPPARRREGPPMSGPRPGGGGRPRPGARPGAGRAGGGRGGAAARPGQSTRRAASKRTRGPRPGRP